MRLSSPPPSRGCRADLVSIRRPSSGARAQAARMPMCRRSADTRRVRPQCAHSLKSHAGLYKLPKNGYNSTVMNYALMRNAWDALSRSEPETGASPDGSIHRESPRSSEPNAEPDPISRLRRDSPLQRKSRGRGTPRQFGWYREAPSSQGMKANFSFGGMQHV